MAIAPPQTVLTAADLAARFGDMPAWRIRTDPPPGTATEEDVLRLYYAEGRFCELIDGTLVEKDVAADSSLIAVWIGTLLNNFVRPRRLGFVLGEQALLRLAVGRLRAPDVSFIRRDQVPGGRFPSTPVPDLDPVLAVEVLSPGNTKREMEEKLDDYFGSGCESVWIVDPAKSSIRVFTARDSESVLRVGDVLDGGSMLPGFSVAVADIFESVELGDAES